MKHEISNGKKFSCNETVEKILQIEITKVINLGEIYSKVKNRDLN